MDNKGVDNKGVSLEEVDALMPIEENPTISDQVANAVIEEQAHLTIWSDKCHNPTSPDYNLKIPPMTYEESIQHSNKDKWLNVMQGELQTMKDILQDHKTTWRP